jgi:hypothetical protein
MQQTDWQSNIKPPEASGKQLATCGIQLLPPKKSNRWFFSLSGNIAYLWTEIFFEV